MKPTDAARLIDVGQFPCNTVQQWGCENVRIFDKMAKPLKMQGSIMFSRVGCLFSHSHETLTEIAKLDRRGMLAMSPSQSWPALGDG